MAHVFGLGDMMLTRERVTVEELSAALLDEINSASITLLDATYYVPCDIERAKREYTEEHIQGAQFFDIDAIAEPDTNLPHMLPSADRFGELVGQLGISNDSFIVVYDRHGVMSAPRVWWMFKTFGHDNVAVLDGGLPAWKAAGKPLSNNPQIPEKKEYRATLRPEWVWSKTQMEANVDSQTALVIDARPTERFRGDIPEPRPGVSSGSIPHSINLPWYSVIDKTTGTLRPENDLRVMIRAFEIESSQPVVCTCGSGITACVNAWAIHQLGFNSVAVYDGSWAEWGAA